ncbi:hypothetical protein GCM10010405_24450 [Streptomyces macrosporus]|uniref:Uncharacterized protein n=1 Tax=Streptomyces macrosporus TaxID=44032 RepID=A0ABN3JUW4_9ACTN
MSDLSVRQGGAKGVPEWCAAAVETGDARVIASQGSANSGCDNGFKRILCADKRDVP